MSANFSYYPPNEPRYILITGAASGLGRCFLDHYTHKHPHASFWAVDRHMPDHKPVYPGLQGRIEWIQLDLTDEAAVREHLELENSLRGQWDLVIHCAGVRGLRVGDGGLRNQKDVEVADGLWQIDKATMMQTFEVNTVGTYLFLRAVSNSLRRAAEAAASGEHQAGRPKVVVMGSRMGSVGHHSSQGGGYAYRASKAALNAVVKSLSVDVPEVIWTVVHPGRVKTGLVDIEEEGAMSVEESIGDCVRLIERLEVKDSGTFVDRFGQNIPW